MNGRLYDPVLARFASADPTVQSPGNMQSYNRYTYGWNNPLVGTDPSGFSWFGDRWHALTGTDWSKSRDQYVKPVVAAAISYYTAGAVSTWANCTAAGASLGGYAGVAAGAAGGAAGGAAMAAMYGGNLEDMLRAAAYGALNGAAFSGLDGMAKAGNWSKAATMGANGLTGGVISRLNGGDFADGFRTSATQYLISSAYKKMEEKTDGFAAEAGTNEIYDPISSQRRTDGGLPCLGYGNCDSLTTKLGMSLQGVLGDEGHGYESIGIYRTFVNAVSKVHDVMNSWGYGTQDGRFGFIGHGTLYNTAFDVLWSFPMMPVAAVVTAVSVDQSGIASKRLLGN